MGTKSNRERQESLRARRLLLGMTEVRGIYLPPELHSSLKEEARKPLNSPSMVALKLLDRLETTHKASLSALDRSSRSTGGTATWRRAYESYEKHAEAFDKAAAALRIHLTSNNPTKGV